MGCTPFDDLDHFAVLTPKDIADRLRINARSMRRAIARGELVGSRTCGLRVLASDAAAWWRGQPRRGRARAGAGWAARAAPARAAPARAEAFRQVAGAAPAVAANCEVVMATTAVPPDVTVRRWERRDGKVTESYTVRWKEPDGTKRRRCFDSVDDALDFEGKRRSAPGWRPEELRKEQAGRRTLDDFFAQWWRAHAMGRAQALDAGGLPLPVGGAR